MHIVDNYPCIYQQYVHGSQSLSEKVGEYSHEEHNKSLQIMQNKKGHLKKKDCSKEH